MRLKRLELQGFKSFLDRTILTFEPGITGVVGPNGCGKSNIVDAIQWVMGEQSAKHLRGDSMTDVIFNGSDSKAPTSMAEVTLVLDRKGVPLAPQFAAFDKAEEIAVTRRVFRDGTGEYLINKTGCRLKDIHELFMDTGVGRRAYSIIEQGQIDRMINVKPEERRHLFEEVAGITKYKAKRKEAEKKLEGTRQNLLRLQDILTELEKQIRSLKVQATRAKKYKELKGELEAIDLFMLGRNLYEHQKSLFQLNARKENVQNLRSESDAIFGQTEAQVTELEILRIDQEKAFQELGEKERNLSLLIQRLESQLTLFEERKKNLKVAVETAQQEMEQMALNLEEFRANEIQEEQEQLVLSEQLEALLSGVREKEEHLHVRESERKQAQARKEELLRKRMKVSHTLSGLESQIVYGQQKELEIDEVRQGLEIRLNEANGLLEAHRLSVAEVETKIADCSQRSQQASEAVAKVSQEVEEISRKLSEMEEALFKAREVFQVRKSRLQSLTELQENLEGYSPTAREILLRLEDQAVSAVPLAEVLQPEAEIEDALEALLGADMNALLVPTAEDAEGLARLIKDKELERVRIQALNEIPTIQTEVVAVQEAISLLSKIRVQSGYEASAQRWLGNVYLAPDQDTLFRLRAQYPTATFVTPDTRTIGHSDRTISSGTAPTKLGVFARKREMESLTAECAEWEAKVNEQSAQREQLLQHLQNQEDLHAEWKDKLSELHIESVGLRKEKEKLQWEVNRSERDVHNLGQDLERNQNQRDDMRSQLESWAVETAEVREESQQVEISLEASEAAMVAAFEGLEELKNAIQESKIEQSRLTEKKSSLGYRLEKTRDEIDETERRSQTLAGQVERDERELQHIDSSRESVEQEKAEGESTLKETLVKIAELKDAFNDTCTRLQDLRAHRNELQKKREELVSELQEIEIKAAHESASLEQLKGISQERYQRDAVALDETAQISIESLPLFASGLEVAWSDLSERERETLLNEHLNSLKEKVSRYGEVNLTAISEFEEIQKRYDFLMEQKTDLEKAIQILEEAIQKIDESTKTRFAETFDAVNTKFKEIFPILFGGGKAELALVNEGNLLEAGVDILVHPPGKRPASITLLSGGEKALTAVSLILAIFARKPSPFCLLDEVDAPLDDANVSRFNTVVRKMAEKTQFILITHNKKTMEVAEALYGVTMEKAGISKMTSVRLH